MSTFPDTALYVGGLAIQAQAKLQRDVRRTEIAVWQGADGLLRYVATVVWWKDGKLGSESADSSTLLGALDRLLRNLPAPPPPDLAAILGYQEARS